MDEKQNAALAVNLSADQEWIRQALEKLAKQQGRSINDALVEALQSYLKAAGENPPRKREHGERDLEWLGEVVPKGPEPYK